MSDLSLTEVLAVWGIKVNKRQALQLLGEMMKPVESGYWCDTEGIYFTDPQDHMTEATWRKRDGGPLGHYGYECEGRKLTRRVVIVEATDE